MFSAVCIEENPKRLPNLTSLKVTLQIALTIIINTMIYDYKKLLSSSFA